MDDPRDRGTIEFAGNVQVDVDMLGGAIVAAVVAHSGGDLLRDGILRRLGDVCPRLLIHVGAPFERLDAEFHRPLQLLPIVTHRPAVPGREDRVVLDRAELVKCVLHGVRGVERAPVPLPRYGRALVSPKGDR